MTFQPRRYLKFQREMSVGDPKEDRIISPNIPLLVSKHALTQATITHNSLGYNCVP